ncbi:MAG: UDP-N-acetylmuramoyl-L-alanyl-D-glutamate--2,6-diaminopimelate ligase [bacterium]|nr:UDP-N-acetylmuramoyl-L-alanyl-D-glutamate--2,6-diaminopimelate ligase [bacterium]
MLTENKKLENSLRLGRKVIPAPLFNLFQPLYHWALAWAGAVIYGFPSRSMKVVGVTGTKGKSTTVFLLAKIFEEAGESVAMIGSLGYKIKEKEWANNLKMTMPGRFRIQKFLAQAKRAGCKYVFLEVTSEGIKQKRHLGIKFDAAVLTNIQKEHLESHGSFEKYVKAKEQLFKKTAHTHILNEDEPLVEQFKKIKSNKKIFYGERDWARLGLETSLKGAFNHYNLLAAAAVAENYRIPVEKIREAVKKISAVKGRMEYIEAGQAFKVVVDYAHTPDSLAMVYDALKSDLPTGGRLIAVLGAAGGGRDKWKRPEFGRIAAHYADEIILTNEDPYDEDPAQILNEIKTGIPSSQSGKLKEILDRREAINTALASAKGHDIIVITGKGSEISMALANGQKISWSDQEVVLEFLKK